MRTGNPNINFNDGKCYVYVYLDPFINKIYNYGDIVFQYEPFYVGKGSGERDLDHIKFAKGIKKDNEPNRHKINRIKNILNKGKLPIIRRLIDGCDHNFACIVEEALIATIGRRDKKEGPLTNLTDGGDGSRGLSEISRQKISQKFKGRVAWNKGIPMTEEGKLHLSILNKGKKKSQPNTEFQRQNASKIHKNKIVSDETKRKQSMAHKGSIPWNKGKKATKPSWNKGLKGIRRKEYQFLFNDEVIVNISDLRKYCKELNISYPSMIEVFKGKRTEYRNYKSI